MGEGKIYKVIFPLSFLKEEEINDLKTDCVLLCHVRVSEWIHTL